MTSTLPPDYLDQFRRRVIQDAMNEATAIWWDRRAEAFEWARAKPGDFPGAATPAERAARDARLAEQAQACRNRARAALIGGEDG